MSTTETKHSPLPWRVERDGGDTHVRDANGNYLACDMSYYPWTFDIDDVELIVRAVNSHADMLEALEQGERELAAFFETYVVNGKGVDDGVSDVLRRMRKAIARAKGAA